MLDMSFAPYNARNSVGIRNARSFNPAKIIVVRMLVLSCPLLVIISHGHAQDKPDNARQLLLPVVEALKAIENPQTGRGSVILKRYDYSGYNERQIEFMFKDELSRTDRFEYSEGMRGERIGARAMGREVYVGFNPYNALVTRKPAAQWYREFSYDFHPATFAHIHHYSVANKIERLIEGPANISVELDSNGLLKMETEYHDDEVELRKIFWLDKTKGFRPVFYERKRTELKGTGGTTKSYFKMSWKQYGRTWYVSKGEYGQAPSSYYIIGEEPRVYRPIKNQVEFVVEDFVPDVNISDSEFTLDGLDLPDGMPVVDRVAGVTYRYGTVPLTMADLEKPLAEAQFPASITNNNDENAEKTSVASEMAGNAPSPNDVNSQPSRSDSHDNLAQSAHRNAYLILGFGALVAFAFILWWKYLHLRREHTE